jgi:choline dehydrogenase-like flavoprotein
MHVIPSQPGSLSPERRARDLAGLAGAAVDVVVVGGGVTGAGVALDAASRGLSVALLERADVAAGTSRWSSKLVHGGLRYLAHRPPGCRTACEAGEERTYRAGRAPVSAVVAPGQPGGTGSSSPATRSDPSNSVSSAMRASRSIQGPPAGAAAGGGSSRASGMAVLRASRPGGRL